MGAWDRLVGAIWGGEDQPRSGAKPQVTADGKVIWLDPQGDSGSTWDYMTKHLPSAVGKTVGEIGLTLSPVGGSRESGDVGTGRQWLQENLGLENRGGESIPEALLKGAAEGVLDTFVPEAGVDVGANILAEGAGGALAGAQNLSRSARALRRPRARASARAKLQENARRPKNVWQGEEGATKAPGYHTQRMQTKAAIEGPPKTDMPQATPSDAQYKGPRPTEAEFGDYVQGSGRRGIPSEARPGTTSPVPGRVRNARRSSEAYAKRQDPVEGHQLRMQQYRAVQEPLEAFDKGVIPQPPGQMGPPRPMTLDDINRMDPETRRLIEQQLLRRAQNAPVAQPVQGPPAPTPPQPMPAMGTADDLADVLQGESNARLGKNLANWGLTSVEDEAGNVVPGYEALVTDENRRLLMQYMYDLFDQYPNMTMQEFLAKMKAAGAPGL